MLEQTLDVKDLVHKLTIAPFDAGHGAAAGEYDPKIERLTAPRTEVVGGFDEVVDLLTEPDDQVPVGPIGQTIYRCEKPFLALLWHHSQTVERWCLLLAALALLR